MSTSGVFASVSGFDLEFGPFGVRGSVKFLNSLLGLFQLLECSVSLFELASRAFWAFPQRFSRSQLAPCGSRYVTTATDTLPLPHSHVRPNHGVRTMALKASIVQLVRSCETDGSLVGLSRVLGVQVFAFRCS